MAELIKLEKEYNNYKTFLSINKLFDGSKKAKKKYDNAIERFLLSRAQLYKQPYAFYKITSIDEKTFEELEIEMEHKKFKNENIDKKYIIKQIKKLINENFEINDKITNNNVNPTFDLTKKIIVYKDFVFPIYHRIKLLLKKTLDLTNVCICILRYLSIGAAGQQCTLPKATYNLLYEKYNVKNEGFGSPFNSKLINYENTRFGSLFYDTDHFFGSIGKFSLDNLINKNFKGNWSVNVPYIPKIIDDTANIIIEALDILKKRGEHKFLFFMMPNWTDSKGLIKLRNSEYHFKTILLKKNECYIECKNSIIPIPHDDTALDFVGTKPYDINEEEIINSALLTDKIKKNNETFGKITFLQPL